MPQLNSSGILGILQGVGFWALHLVGWIGYVPLSGIALIFYALFLMVVSTILGGIIKTFGVDGARIALSLAVIAATLIAMCLRMLGVPVGFDPHAIQNPWKVPVMLIGSIFALMRPNRLTFLLGCALSAILIPQALAGRLL